MQPAAWLDLTKTSFNASPIDTALDLSMLPPCSHRPPCPSCPSYGVALADKEGIPWLRRVSERHGVPLQLREAAPLAYRHRARLAVRGRTRSPKVGVFQLGSHTIVDIPACKVHHPAINHVAQAVKQLARSLGVAPYSEPGQRGLLRYLQVTVSRGDGSVQLVVVANDGASDSLRPFLTALSQQLGPTLHSLFWNGQTSAGNAILGIHWEHLLGPSYLEESFGGARVFVPPSAFMQANTPLFSTVVDAIHGFVEPDTRVLELYAGVGAIGLGLADRCSALLCNEVAGGSLTGLRAGHDALPSETRQRVSVLPGPAASHGDRVSQADVVIADPPRKGLDPEVIASLLKHRPRRFIYLSCGLQSFLRDEQALTAGGFKLVHLEAIDLFPQTEHIETLAVFDAETAPTRAAGTRGR